jgi:hypothetical protein
VAAAITAIKNGVAAAGDTLTELYTLITNHTSNTSNPHSVTKSQVGLNNVDNTSDATKFLTGTIKEDIFVIPDAAGYVLDPANGSIQRWTLTASRTPGADSHLNELRVMSLRPNRGLVRRTNPRPERSTQLNFRLR